MGTMICCKLAQRASLNMIRRIDLLTEILFVHDRFSQILCETYTIVFGFSASMSTTRHGTFKWTMGVIALATAIHEVEHFILGGLDSRGLLDWLGKSIIVDCCGNIDQTEQHSQEALKTLLFAKHGFSQGAPCERVGQLALALHMDKLGSMVNPTAFFLISGTCSTFDVDVLHRAPQRTLW